MIFSRLFFSVVSLRFTEILRGILLYAVLDKGARLFNMIVKYNEFTSVPSLRECRQISPVIAFFSLHVLTISMNQGDANDHKFVEYSRSSTVLN